MRRAGKVLLPLAFWGAVWALLALRVGQELLLPAPTAVLTRLWALAGTGDFWRAAGVTLLRVFSGAAAGVTAGAAIAALSARFTVADWLCTPLVKVIRATPVASFIILIWLWSPTRLVPAAVAGLMALPVAWSAVRQGIEGVDGKLRELCAAYRFGAGKTLRVLYLPAVWPSFAAGSRTALGLAWKAGVAAEVLCLPKWAIGTQVYYAKLYLETTDLFAWTALVIALSFLVERGVGALLERGGGRGGA